MKTLILALIALPLWLSAQKPIAEKVHGKTFTKKQIFTTDAATGAQSTLLPAPGATVVKLVDGVIASGAKQSTNDKEIASQSLAMTDNIEVVIPYTSGNITLQLFEADIFTDDFKVSYSAVIASGAKQSTNDKGIASQSLAMTGKHYWGIVKGNDNSLATLNFFDDEVTGLISTASGTLTIGKLKNSPYHVIYDENALKQAPPQCFGVVNPYTPPMNINLPPSAPTKCVRNYWEINYDLFQASGANTLAFVTTLFNQNALLYAADGITMKLSEVFIWNTPSPYTGTNTFAILQQFWAFRNSWNGDIAHLVGIVGNGGIASGYTALCTSNPDNAQCYSGLSHISLGRPYPQYSWHVNVTSHEAGHLLGSHHTHACVWNNNGTAIDNCAPSAGYAYEGSCCCAPTPVGGGTVMSYCHLTNVTINFLNGFGPQPKALIQNNIIAAQCLQTCGPAGTCTISVSPASATVASAAGSTTFTLNVNEAWTISEACDWLTVTPTSGTGNATVTITYNANAGTQARQCVITASCSSTSAPFIITQNGTAPPQCSLEISPIQDAVTASAGTRTIQITSASSWTVSNACAWATATPASGTGNALVTVAFQTNTGAQRSCNISIQTCNNISRNYSLTQSGTAPPGCTLSVAPRTVGVNANSGRVVVVANSSGTVSVGSVCSWISLSRSGNFFTFNYQSNSSTASRKCVITFTCGSATATFTLNQAGRSFKESEASSEERVEMEKPEVSSEERVENTTPIGNVRVFNVWGQLIYKGEYRDFNAERLTGVYLMQMENGKVVKIVIGKE